MIKNRGIAFKLYLGFLLVISIIIGLGAYNYVTLEDLSEDVAVADDEIIRQTLTAIHMRMEVLEIQDLFTDSAATGEKDGILEAKKMAEEFRKFSKDFYDHEKADETRKFVKEIDANFEEFYETGHRMALAFINDDKNKNEVMEEFDGDGEKLHGQIEELVGEHTNELTAHFKMMRDDTIKAERVTLFAIILSIITGLLLAIGTSRVIVNALSKVSAQLQSISHQVRGASHELAESAQELSSAANEQASAVEETSASLEEISGMIKNNVGNSENASNISRGVSGKTKAGNDLIQNLKTSMGEILENNKNIEELVRVISNIGEKTQVIDEIVFQTKLLSFNASVEAERAGEHGRGFAVVAQEVGNLAQMSGKAAKEISTIVKDSIVGAEKITNDNKQKVVSGNDYVTQVSDIFLEITENAETLEDQTESVHTASSEQSSGMGQIANAVSQIDQATQQIASTSEETASTGEELSGQVESMNNIVEELIHIVKGKQKNTNTNKMHAHNNVDVRQQNQSNNISPVDDGFEDENDNVMQISGF